MKRVLLTTLWILVSFGLVEATETGDLRKMRAWWNPTVPDNYSAGVMEAECYVNASTEAIWHVMLKELDQWEEFIPQTLFSQIISPARAEEIRTENPHSFKEVQQILGEEDLPLEKRLRRKSATETEFYRLVYLDFPWPLGNRWLLTREVESKSGKNYHRHFEMIAGSLVLTEGDWWVQSESEHPGWSHIKYRLVADGGIHVPHIFYKMGAPRVAKATLNAIRARAEARD